MKDVIKTLAPEKYEVMRGEETTIVQIVPQIVSSLRKDLTLWEDPAGLPEYLLFKIKS